MSGWREGGDGLGYRIVAWRWRGGESVVWRASSGWRDVGNDLRGSHVVLGGASRCGGICAVMARGRGGPFVRWGSCVLCEGGVEAAWQVGGVLRAVSGWRGRWQVLRAVLRRRGGRWLRELECRVEAAWRVGGVLRAVTSEEDKLQIQSGTSETEKAKEKKHIYAQCFVPVHLRDHERGTEALAGVKNGDRGDRICVTTRRVEEIVSSGGLICGVGSHCHSVQAALSARPHPNTLPPTWLARPRHVTPTPRTGPRNNQPTPTRRARPHRQPAATPSQHGTQRPTTTDPHVTANPPPCRPNTALKTTPHADPPPRRPNTACRSLPPPTRHAAPPQHGLKTPSPPTRHAAPTRRARPRHRQPVPTPPQHGRKPITADPPRHRNAARKTPPSPP
ncbi:hypothetical protein EDB89DRAFT_1911701 [Lactarius sanguifluus]|nr:hypothetical protein EDB89DRAFT_1911701 [Lactarius sanguifluus]